MLFRSEIVKKLEDLKLLSVIYTRDGKEYLTSVELGKEIREEILARGGDAVDFEDLVQYYCIRKCWRWSRFRTSESRRASGVIEC